jgi:hypothetical protein
MAPSIIKQEKCLISWENSLDHRYGNVTGMADNILGLPIPFSCGPKFEKLGGIQRQIQLRTPLGTQFGFG